MEIKKNDLGHSLTAAVLKKVFDNSKEANNKSIVQDMAALLLAINKYPCGYVDSDVIRGLRDIGSNWEHLLHSDCGGKCDCSEYVDKIPAQLSKPEIYVDVSAELSADDIEKKIIDKMKKNEAIAKQELLDQCVDGVESIDPKTFTSLSITKANNGFVISELNGNNTHLCPAAPYVIQDATPMKLGLLLMRITMDAEEVKDYYGKQK